MRLYLAIAIATAATADESIPGVRLTRDDTNAKHSFADLWHDAGEQQDWVVETRRELHRTPELLFDEKQTSAKIAQVLTALQVNFTSGWAKNTKRAELAAKGFVSGRDVPRERPPPVT